MLSIHEELTALARALGLPADGLRLPEVTVDPDAIRVAVVNEGPPPDPADAFWATGDPADLRSALALFADAGVEAQSLSDLIGRGLYLTTAIKTPKTEYAVDPAVLAAHLPLLSRELSLFPHLQAIVLAGDVARKAVNQLAKAQTGRNVIPSGATYRIRGGDFRWGGLRVFPSYVITGGNLLIEKSKRTMIAEDLRRVQELL